MSGAAILGLPNFEEMFVVEADTSDIGIGAILMQRGQPLCNFNRKLGPRMRIVATYQKELFAIVESVYKWRGDSVALKRGEYNGLALVCLLICYIRFSFTYEVGVFVVTKKYKLSAGSPLHTSDILNLNLQPILKHSIPVCQEAKGLIDTGKECLMKRTLCLRKHLQYFNRVWREVSKLVLAVECVGRRLYGLQYRTKAKSKILKLASEPRWKKVVSVRWTAEHTSVASNITMTQGLSNTPEEHALCADAGCGEKRACWFQLWRQLYGLQYRPKVRILQKSQEKSQKPGKNEHETERVHKSRVFVSKGQQKSTKVNQSKSWSTRMRTKPLNFPKDP
ncbi:ty3-gypsy retrotransposon protein [Tanacetum coccineum]